MFKAILYNRKNVSTFNLSLVPAVKIKLNFHYKRMTEKMYDNLQEKYKNSIFQILKICKGFSNFDFNSKITKKIHWVAQLLGNKVIERFLLTSHTEIQVSSPTYLFSIYYLILCFFKGFFSFSNLHTRKIKSKYTIYEVNPISLCKTIPQKNQTISIH